MIAFFELLKEAMKNPSVPTLFIVTIGSLVFTLIKLNKRNQIKGILESIKDKTQIDAWLALEGKISLDLISKDLSKEDKAKVIRQELNNQDMKAKRSFWLSLLITIVSALLLFAFFLYSIKD